VNSFQAIILAIIEGITEFLPVSSTGHIIVASSIMGIASDPFTKLFTVGIQLGAILSVIVLYLKHFFKSLDFYFKLLIGFIPAAVLGILFGDFIDSMLENVIVVAIALLLGGIVFLFVDKWFAHSVTHGEQNVSYGDAFRIGLFQCFALLPGVSRSAASIIGGLFQNLTRKTAAEFSFFLAVPTMFGATAKKLYDFYRENGSLTSEQIKLLILGNIVAFIVAMIAIKSFIAFLTKHGFKLFGWYRITLGVGILLLYLLGYTL
jgi:undecaprenyl-diphosphatase